MNIAIIVRKLNVTGGTQRQALSLAREFKQQGHRVVLYTFLYDKKRCYPDLLEDLDVRSLAYYPLHSYFFLDLIREQNAAKNLASLIERDTDILHPHDQASHRVAYYFKKKIKNIPSVWMMNDLPIKRWSFWREQQMNPSLSLSFIKTFAYWLFDFYEIQKFIRAQDAITVLDDKDKEWVRYYFKKQAIVVRSGLDSNRFFYTPRTHVSRPAQLLMSGIFFTHRRFEDGIKAIKILKGQGCDVVLSIRGAHRADDPYVRRLQQLVHRLDLQRYVTFAGPTSSDREHARTLVHADIFLFPNHLQSWGLVVFEAMATGTPVVVSKSAGASEVLTDKKNALLVNPKSPAEIAKAVKTLIDNPALYRRLSRNGRMFVEQNISWSRQAKKLLALFEDILKHK